MIQALDDGQEERHRPFDDWDDRDKHLYLDGVQKHVPTTEVY